VLRKWRAVIFYLTKTGDKSAPLLFRAGISIGRFLAAGFFVTRFLITARLFTAGFLTPMFVATLLFTGRRLDAAQGAAEGLNLALIVKLLAFRQFNQLLDFFHLIECLFQGLDNAAYVVRRLGNGRIRIADMLLRGGRAVNRLPLNRWLFHRRRFGSRRFNGRGFGNSVLWRCFGRLVCGRRRCTGRRLPLATSTTAATSASAM
jgi:hypothetical protein